MKREVAATLGELERKLRELERELAAVSRGEEQTASEPAPRRDTEARLIDEREAMRREPEPSRLQGSVQSPPPAPDIAQRYAGEARQPSREPIQPASRSELSIDLVELVRFRERLQSTMTELIDEYGRILSLRSSGASSDRP